MSSTIAFIGAKPTPATHDEHGDLDRPALVRHDLGVPPRRCTRSHPVGRFDHGGCHCGVRCRPRPFHFPGPGVLRVFLDRRDKAAPDNVVMFCLDVEFAILALIALSRASIALVNPEFRR